MTNEKQEKKEEQIDLNEPHVFTIDKEQIGKLQEAFQLLNQVQVKGMNDITLMAMAFQMFDPIFQSIKAVRVEDLIKNLQESKNKPDLLK